jgi:hypothetical protein
MLHPMNARWSLAGLLSGLALFGFCAQAWPLPAHYILTPIGPVSPPTCSLSNEAVCIGPHAVAIADDSTVVVGNVQNASSDFTPYQFAPTSQALPGMDGTSFGGLDALTHQFNTGGFAEAAEGTRIVGEITRPGSGNDFHAVLWDTGTVTDLETQSRIPLQWSTAEAVNADDVCGSANGIPACWLSGVFVTLPTLSPYPDNGGDVTALNDQGNAAGASYVVGVGSHCAYWPVTGGVVDCHSPWAGAESAAEDMNNSNQIVGTTDTPGNPRPVFQRGFLVLPWGMILLEPFGGMERRRVGLWGRGRLLCRGRASRYHLGKRRALRPATPPPGGRRLDAGDGAWGKQRWRHCGQSHQPTGPEPRRPAHPRAGPCGCLLRLALSDAPLLSGPL